MTDPTSARPLPRRSYPLVVPPPGGFEEAVHRGRRLRRRRTGSGSALALMLVGALAYSMLGGRGGTNGLDPVNQPPVSERTDLPGPSATPSTPRSSPDNARSGDGSTTASGPRGGNPVTSATPDTSVVPPVRDPGDPTRPYAKRQPIGPAEDLGPNTDTNCLISSTSTASWCATTTVTDPNPENENYVLRYTLCRNVNAGAITLHFHRKQQVDWVATDLTHSDTVWTYSAGQPVVTADDTLRFDAGYCMSWTVEWNGYDDYGDTPQKGTYRLTARALSVESVPPDSDDFTE